MIITSVDPYLIQRYLDKSPIEVFNENVHPAYARSIGLSLNQKAKEKDIVCYNSLVLDYIDLENIFAIQDDLSLIRFDQLYKEKLQYLYPGEVLMNMTEDLDK